MPSSTKTPSLTSALEVSAALRAVSDAKKIKILSSFFKTGEGQYGFGDVFIGVTVPQNRTVVKAARNLSLTEVEKLLSSPIHEERLCALLIWVDQFDKGSEAERKKISAAYLKNRERVNNWDLVDASAEQIIGPSVEKNFAFIERLSRSPHLWSRRIAVVATFYCIKRQNPEPIFTLAKKLLNDPHDLMHKSIGWMLREVGKRISPELLRAFLHDHAAQMPRTMLRYAIEHFSPAERQKFLSNRRPDSRKPLPVSSQK